MCLGCESVDIAVKDRDDVTHTVLRDVHNRIAATRRPLNGRERIETIVLRRGTDTAGSRPEMSMSASAMLVSAYFGAMASMQVNLQTTCSRS